MEGSPPTAGLSTLPGVTDSCADSHLHSSKGWNMLILTHWRHSFDYCEILLWTQGQETPGTYVSTTLGYWARKAQMTAVRGGSIPKPDYKMGTEAAQIAKTSILVCLGPWISDSWTDASNVLILSPPRIPSPPTTNGTMRYHLLQAFFKDWSLIRILWNYFGC